jgi:DNA ligase-associated metallophosphoesterase
MANQANQGSRIKLSLFQQDLVLHAEKAIYWPGRRMLIIADLHLGKGHHFRKSGIPVPGTLDLENLRRIRNLISEFDPEEVLFLGDLFHSSYNESWQEVKALTSENPKCNFTLVQGNHDIMDENVYQHADILLFDGNLIIDPFIFSHHPLSEIEGGFYNIAGHIHPAARLIHSGKQSLTFPCFHIGMDQAILPAFGEFTGMHVLPVKNSDRIYIICEGVILPT